MSYEGWTNNSYNGNWQDQNRYSYDMNNPEFGQEQHFQNFDYSQSSAQQNVGMEGASAFTQQPAYFDPGPSLMTPSAEGVGMEDYNNDENEPPLLEELGIDPDAIMLKTLNVLNPLRHTDPSILQDTDLAGPLVFCLTFGAFLLLSGKVHFGYIYGIGLLGCLGLYALINLMSIGGAGLGVIVSVLGYCLLPMVGLSGLNVVFSLQGPVGIVLTATAIVWCSWSASKLFVTAFSMSHQQPLIAYPCALFYAVFALITIF